MNDGAANVSVNGGTPPYNIIWSNGLTDTSLTGFAASYFASINDQNNCNGKQSHNRTC